MNKKFLALLLSGTMISATSANAQSKAVDFTIPVKNGSVFMSLGDKHIDKTYLAQNLPALLGLSEKHTFTKLDETTDDLGFTHIGYQQFFQGIKVENGMILVHVKNGIVNSINGHIAQINTINVTPAIDRQSVPGLAKTNLDVIKELRQYPVELVIANAGSSKLPEYALSYKVRVDGKTSKGKVVMMNVFADARTGKVLKKVSLIAHTDVNATAQTLYNGTQTIVTDDSIPGMYRLKDNARKIITLDAAGSDFDINFSSNVYFFNPREITNNSTTWGEKPALMKMRMNTISNTLGSYIDFNSGIFLASTVVKDVPGQGQQNRAWLDLRYDAYDATALPTTTENLYIFPNGDTTLQGSFGIFDFSMMSLNLQPACYFPINNLAVGTHNWNAGNNNTGTYTISSAKNPALDVHWGMERTHDFYLQKFNRNSYDGNGSKLVNYVNGVWATSFDQNNAAALPAPYFAMVYGMGDGQLMKPVVAIDVTGHEFTHMVTEKNGHGGLDYQDESGALNESFSDIMGTAIDFFANGTAANWTIGEQVTLPALGAYMRSMSDPKSATMVPQPDTYLGDFWDLSDPHICSGVQNKWFYLLSAGGTGTNDNNDSYNVYGVGIEKAQQIAYRNLTNYLTPAATFMDAYNGSILAAKDLYGDTSQAYHSVRNAWYAVGIGDQDTTKVTEPPVVGINDLQLNGQHLQIYPNPASSTITITSDIAQNLNAQIINVAGVKVMDIKIHKGSNAVNVQSLAKGPYFVKYDNGNNGFVQKLSIQ